ncbi:leucine-rich repeat-containing protein 9 isoform X2 [Halichoeres trimaculatus]|uniref:leucine-rich repeat-containing protein 9 isoform X2 n=1 Tax=Halichoeres trimaculatus TaxID=147232 RepID=UPI003D9F6019
MQYMERFQDTNVMIQSEKQKHRSDEDVVKELCIANGVSYEKIAKEGSNIRALEIFFSGFPRIEGLNFFPKLRQLTIVSQNIKNIDGLDCCPLLQELWIVQCNLTEISGLQKCRQLKKLYLYDNQICEIRHLQFQVDLEVLWLNNNCISQIQGLKSLQNLKELNLVDNSIEKIGHGLDHNVCLQNLNLSGNKISSFKELTRLAHLPDLRELTLNDPTSTPNPVCLLCNYATHVLYHMPGLQRLDTYDVSNKQVKDAAESTVMKKMMYYNMRVRTAQRILAESRLSLMERKRTMLQIPKECVRTISHALKNLERELSKVPAGCRESASTLKDESSLQVQGSADRSGSPTNTSPDSAMEHKILHKIKALQERLMLWTRRMDEIEAWFQQALAQTTHIVEYTVQFLLMELESVGNIRLEEGCSTDPWFTSCCDLLLSRFCHSDFEIYGITGIKISKVIRIHNSALRLRFEDRFHILLAGEESSTFSQRNYRRRLEHLFYAADPEENNEREEILSIIEEGFKTVQPNKTFEIEGAIPLSNSLIVTEQPRIEHALGRVSQGKTDTNAIPFSHGQIMVSKVFVGHSMPIREGQSADRSSYSKVYSVYRNLDTKQRTSTSEETVHSSKKHTGLECSPRKRQWFMFDHELILPEYIICFEYIMGDTKHPLPGHNTGAHGSPSNDFILDKEALNIEPVLKPQPELFSLDDKILLSVAGANVLSQITVLNLHGNSLNKIKEISHLTSLRHLTISFNKFTHLNDITHMPNLEFLDASFNCLVTLEGLRGLARLKHLDVSWNKLTKAREDTAVLRKHTPALLRLNTRYNPWNKPEAVRRTILGSLTTLTHLDDLMVAEEEAADAIQMAAGSKISQASLLVNSRTNDDRPRSLSLLSTAQLLCIPSPANWSMSTELEPGWTAKITTLNLDNQRISKLTNLNKLTNLRWASFNNNDISRVEGLECCTKLEELSLCNNMITTFNGLSKLHYLSKLNLDGNQLTSLDASVLDQLSNLSFLSMENNCITSLHGIQRVRSLLELYIGNNRISTSQDIYFLKGLSNLIILDLYGNPLLEQLENYRIYVVFHLPSLRALDGIAVEVTECENAKDMFGGRLTPDMVAEKLGHSNYTDITYLTLQSCSIRMVDLSPADLFCNLRSVNLDNNNLTSFSGLIYLPNIKALCLNYNHIESILPRQKTRAHLTNRQILYSKVHSSGYGKQSPPKGKGETGPSGSLEPVMGSLEVLHLSHNGISNMANLQLSRLTNLKALFLQDNEISQVEGLDGLHQLRELVLDRNRIKTLSENSFIGQNFLLELHMAENRIRELNHLDPLTQLHKLFLGMNKLQDITELEKLEVLPSLSELSVVSNPVARNSLHRPAVVLRLSSLQVLDGVTVTLEERTRAELLSADPSSFIQCPGASLPAAEITLPGLRPLLPRNPPLRAMGLGGGLQSSIPKHDLLPSNTEEVQYHYTYTNKRSKHFNDPRIHQTDTNFRHIRRTGSNLPTSGLFSDGNRVIITYPSQEQDSRFPSGGRHPPM